MGCQNSASIVQNPSRNKNAQKLDSYTGQKMTLEKMMKTVRDVYSNQKQNGNFNSYLWEFIRQKVQGFYLNQIQTLQLCELYSDLIQINVSSKQLVETPHIQKIGRGYAKLFNRLQFKQEQVFDYLNIMVSSNKIPELAFKTSFLEFKYDLSIQQSASNDNINKILNKSVQNNQLLYVANQTFKFCKKDFDSIAFLSLYLQLSIQKLFESQKDIFKIETTLKQKLEKLCKIFPEIQANQSINIIGEQQLKLQSADKIQEYFETIRFSSHQTETNNFIQLQKFIIEKSKHAKQDLALFDKIVGPACKQLGYGFISGVKIKGQKDQSSIWRTIEKLVERSQFEEKFVQFKKQVQQKYKSKLTSNQMNLKQYVNQEKELSKQFIKSLINQTSSLIFDSKDLVRGKCIYNKLQDIIQTVKSLKKQIKEKSAQNCQIIEIKNQLRKKNMVKIIIKLPNSIAELQLVAKLEKISNQFNHKLYQIARSKIYTIVTNLLVHHQKWSGMFFNDLRCNIEFIKQKKIDLKNSKNGHQQKLYQKSKQFFKLLNTFNQKRQKKLQQNQNHQLNRKIEKIRNILLKGSQKLNQSTETQKCFALISFLYGGSQYNEAIKIFKQFQNQNQNEQSIKYAQLLNLVGTVYLNQSKYDLSLEKYKASLSIKEKLEGKDSIGYAITLQNIGIVYKDQSKYDIALENYKASLSIKEKIVGKNSMDYAISLQNIGVVYQYQSKYDFALENYKASLSIKEKLVGKDSMPYATTLQNIGIIYKNQSKYDLALENYKASLSIKEKLVGKDSMAYAKTLQSIGVVYKSQSKYDLALENYKASLFIKEKLVGKDSIGYAIILQNIGIIYKNQSKYDLALENYQASISITEKLVGKDSMDYAITLQNIGIIYKNQNKFDLALENYKKSLSIKEKLVGKNSMDYAIALQNIGAVYDIQDKYDLALENYKASLSIKEKLVGKDSVSYAKTLQNIAGVYEIQSKYDLALENFKESLSIYQKLVGKDSIDYARALYCISFVYENLQDIKNAYQCLNQSYLIYQKLFGQNNPNTKDSLKRLQKMRQILNQ